jgi:hypothetical protein
VVGARKFRKILQGVRGTRESEKHRITWFVAQKCDIFVFKIIDRKAIPLQSWTGPESSRRLRFPDF